MSGRRAARPKRTCDAPGCTAEVGRGMLMCRAHWFALPGALRRAIKETWAARQLRAWSANCLEARAFLANRPAHSPAGPTSPEQAYALQQRMLGERDE